MHEKKKKMMMILSSFTYCNWVCNADTVLVAHLKRHVNMCTNGNMLHCLRLAFIVIHRSVHWVLFFESNRQWDFFRSSLHSRLHLHHKTNEINPFIWQRTSIPWWFPRLENKRHGRRLSFENERMPTKSQSKWNDVMPSERRKDEEKTASI